MSLHAYYQDKIVSCRKEIRSLQKKLNSLAVLRVLLFACFAWSVDRLIRQFSDGWFFLSVLAAAAFIFCVNLYLRWKDERRLQEKLRFVCENELAVLGGADNGFSDGSAWLDKENYLDDLDIFGPRSLFHLLDRTTTRIGATALANRLRQSIPDVASIGQQQVAIRVLTPQTAIRQLLTASGLVKGEAMQKSGTADSQDDWTAGSPGKWLDTPPHLIKKRLLPVILSALSLFNLYGLYRYFDDGNYTLIIAGILVSRLITGIFSSYINHQHRLLGRQHARLDQYAGILTVFNQANTDGSDILRQLQDASEHAHDSIRRLSRLSSYFDQRLNLLVNLVLNTFFFYDLFCMMALERWKTANKASFPGWIDAVGMIECLNSLSTFAYNHPEYSFPTPVAADDRAVSPGGSRLFIEATRLAHPMIPSGRRVANDVSIGHNQRLILVTGSNMSGKTTFLRTVGVNLLMAQCGLPVCASTFSFTPMQLLTSLRITDSLQEQTSYFMAELNKLHMIIYRLRTGEPALVLIDEILRGTNSEDKTYGSGQFIHRLLEYPCLAFFATHDLTLGELEQKLPNAVNNYCFESVIEGDELHFDYQLRRGIALNRNASFLMRRMDII